MNICEQRGGLWSISVAFTILFSVLVTPLNGEATNTDQSPSNRDTFCASNTSGGLSLTLCDHMKKNGSKQALFTSSFIPGGAKAQMVVKTKTPGEIENLYFRAIVATENRGYEAVTMLSGKSSSGDANEFIVTLAVPEIPGYKLWWPKVTVLLGEYKKDDTKGTSELINVYREQITVSGKTGAFGATLIFLMVLYGIVVFVGKTFGDGKAHINPIHFCTGTFGRASISKLQIFFFSFVIIGVIDYILFRYGILPSLSTDVLLLLGISAGSTVAAKVTTTKRKRFSLHNWAWLKDKGWVSTNPETPKWEQLLTTDGKFDVYKFQMFAFSPIVAGALVATGGAASGLGEFTIPNELLGVLGLSQVVYLSGKIVTPSSFEDIGKQLDVVREKENEFITKVSENWQQDSPPKKDLDNALQTAPNEYREYKKAAKDAVLLFESSQSKLQEDAKLEPDFLF
jgi:hypothetical protein